MPAMSSSSDLVYGLTIQVGLGRQVVVHARDHFRTMGIAPSALTSIFVAAVR